MIVRSNQAILAALLILLFLPAAGVTVTQTQSKCMAADMAIDLIQKYRLDFPDDWTIVIVCTPMEWNYLLNKTRMTGHTGRAFTSLRQKVTWVNGEYIVNPDMRRPSERVLAHELGHIRCNCASESEAAAEEARLLHPTT